MRNRNLIEGEEQSDDEDRDAEGPSAKRRRTDERVRTDRVTLDAEEAVFASIFSPLRPSGDGDGIEEGDRDEEGDVDEEGDGDGGSDDGRVQHGSIAGGYVEDEAEVSGFLDNGVCYSVFSRKLY